MTQNSLGTKSRGNSLGKKVGSALKKGVKAGGLALVAGAGIYAAYHSEDRTHQNHEEETGTTDVDRAQAQVEAERAHEELMANAPTVPRGANNVVFVGPGGQQAGPLDKVEDILDVANVALEGVRDVKDEEGKFKKAKAAKRAAGAVNEKRKEIGAKGRDQKLAEGELDSVKESKAIEKKKKAARKQLTIDKCNKDLPGKKNALLRKACKKSKY